MDIVMSSQAKKAGRSKSVADDLRRLKRVEFEMVLETGDAGGKPFAESLQKAAAVAGGEVLFTLPAAGGIGATGLLRLVEGGASRFVQVRAAETGFIISEEAEIDADLLGFARASVDVLERLRADRRVIAPLVSTAQ
jgi:hypothetical protein